MKAIRAVEPYNVQWVDMEKPALKHPRDLRIRVRAAGVCGSDIHIWHGTNINATYPRILGHEIAGEVEAVGPQVERLKVGDRVVLEPTRSCGSCYACANGRPNVCQSLEVFGVHADGGFCEYFVADEGNFHKVPDSLPFEHAALIEPCTIAAQSVWRGGVRTGDLVLIQGAGPIGLLIANAAKSLGTVVIVSEVNAHRLGIAGQFGADHLINPAEQDLKARLGEITNGMGPNVIFEATGVPALISETVEIASVAGRIVPLAFNTEPIPVNFSQIVKKELAICGTRLQTHQFAPVIERFEENLERVSRLITGVYPAEEFMRAFNDFVARDSKHCKVMLTF